MRRGDAGVLDRAATQWTSTVNPPGRSSPMRSAESSSTKSRWGLLASEADSTSHTPGRGDDEQPHRCRPSWRHVVDDLPNHHRLTVHRGARGRPRWRESSTGPGLE